MHDRIAEIASAAGARSIAVAFHDYEHDLSWSYRGDRWFHAASTIKVAVLVGVFAAVAAGRFRLESRLHVRNRFVGAVDGEPFRVGSDNDSNSTVHAAIGRTMRVKELAHHMIATSSNLATNLLLDLVGLDAARAAVAALGADGVDLRRGVEDHRAFEADVNNRVTANGLVALFRAIEEGRAVSADASRHMIEILLAQEFNGGIPAGLPDGAQVAHKTGEISTIAHDAGLVYLPRRRPLALAVLSEWPAETGGRQETIARVSRALYDYLEGRR